MNHQYPHFRNISLVTLYCFCNLPTQEKKTNAKMHVFSTLAGLSSLKQQLQGVNDKSKVISSFQLIFCGSPNPMAWSTVQNLERNRNWSLPSLRHKNGGVNKNGHRPGKVRKEEPKSSEEGWEIVLENDTLVVSRMLFCKWFSWPHFVFLICFLFRKCCNVPCGQQTFRPHSETVRH